MRPKILVVGAIVMLWGLYALVDGPVAARQKDIRQEFLKEHSVLLDYERFMDSSIKAEDKLKELRKEVEELESHLIQEKDSSLASAWLQMKIQDLAESAGMDVTAIRPMQPKIFEDYRELYIHVEGRGNIIRVGNFLKALDSLKMFVGVEDIRIKQSNQDTLKFEAMVKGISRI
jgi:Tfp pilus assembly protein PilO